MTSPEPEVTERPTYTGLCHGGPLDGKTMISRFPAGFLLVDKPGGLVWIYDTIGSGWDCRASSPEPWNRDKSYDAANGNTYDVIALGAGEQT